MPTIVPSNADISYVYGCPQMIAKLLSSKVEQRDEIVTMLHDHSPRRDPASLLELDDFPTGLSGGLKDMGISSDRLITVMTLVIPGAEVFSSDASEDGVDAPLVEDEVSEPEEQPARHADGHQHPPCVAKPAETKGDSSTSTVFDRLEIIRGRKRRMSEQE